MKLVVFALGFYLGCLWHQRRVDDAIDRMMNTCVNESLAPEDFAAVVECLNKFGGEG